jgi:hypothetical protein
VNSKIIVFAVSALGLLIALFLGMAVGEGKQVQIALVFGAMVGAPLLLSLGKNYWYLIPASLLSGLPAIPIGGRSINLSELCIALCFGIFITRTAFKLDKIVLLRASQVPIYLFIAWVLIIFCLYPVGLAAFGAATMGGRFYIQLLLAFIAFLIIASREITDKDCKLIIYIILIGNLIGASYGILSYFFFGTGDQVFSSDSEGYYTWHQNLGLISMAIAFIIFSWKGPKEIFGLKSFKFLAIYVITIGLTLISGKRMALVAVFLAPLVSAIAFKQIRYIYLGALVFTIFSAIVVLGHGDYFRLPLVAQRTLSWLPANWDSEFQHMEKGQDPFRETLRRFAMENIKRDPIVGRGFAIEHSEIIAQLTASRMMMGNDFLAAPYAVGRSWHNTWLGYAADFGIPLSVIQALVYLTVLIVTFKTVRLLPQKTPRFIFSVYVLIFTVRDIIASHTSGHTALDAYERWWMYAVIFSIYASVTARKKEFEPLTQPRTPMQKMFAGQSN